VPHDPIAWYDAHAPEIARTYEAIEAAHLHAWLVDLLPPAGAAALDVGAGTGRLRIMGCSIKSRTGLRASGKMGLSTREARYARSDESALQ